MYKNTGKIEVLPSGNYRANYSYNKVRNRKTFPTKGMAQSWLEDEQDYIRQCERNGVPYQSYKERQKKEKEDLTTLNEWFDSDYMTRTDIRYSTKQTSLSLWDTWVRPFIGTQVLAKVTPLDVREYMAKIQKLPATKERKKLSKDRAAVVYKTLATVFNRAVKYERITLSPCQSPEYGRRPKTKEKDLLTTEQLAIVLREIGEHYQLAVKLASACSMRVGEWSELRKKDVDVIRDNTGAVVGALLHIERGVSTDKGKEVVDETKTEAGVRKVTVPGWLAPELAAHVDALADSEDLLFLRESGLRVTRQSFNKKLTRAGKKAGYVRSNLTTHQLRHFGATEFLRAGGTVADIKKRMGHTTSEMAMRYLHASQQRDAEIANSMPAFVIAPAEEQDADNE